MQGKPLPKRRGRSGTVDRVSLEGLLLAKKLVSELGSVEAAKKTLEVLESLS